MPKAYVMGHAKVTNPEKFAAEYSSKVEETIQAFGGQFLVRGGDIIYREGEKLGDVDIVVEFPDRESAIAWEGSEQYQAILPGRTENATTYLIIIDGVE